MTLVFRDKSGDVDRGSPIFFLASSKLMKKLALAHKTLSRYTYSRIYRLNTWRKRKRRSGNALYGNRRMENDKHAVTLFHVHGTYLRKRSQRLEAARHRGGEAPLPADARQEQLVRRGRALVGPVGPPQLLHCLVGAPGQLRVRYVSGGNKKAVKW